MMTPFVPGRIGLQYEIISGKYNITNVVNVSSSRSSLRNVICYSLSTGTFSYYSLRYRFRVRLFPESIHWDKNDQLIKVVSVVINKKIHYLLYCIRRLLLRCIVVLLRI